MSVENLIVNLQECLISEDQPPEDVSKLFTSFLGKLSESTRTSVKRCKDRCLDEAIQMLKQIPEEQLRGLQSEQLQLLVRLLITMQIQMVNISTACRKLDQMLQHLGKVDHQLVATETLHRLQSLFQRDQIPSQADLQTACMFLEDSAVGRKVWRTLCVSMLKKISDLFPVLMQDKCLSNGPLCYLSVKVCLQVFQLLSREVAPLVWKENNNNSPVVQKILQALMNIILGQCCNRDTRLLAGTAVAMLINTATQSQAGGAAAWSLHHISYKNPWQLTVGVLQVDCDPVRKDGVDRLAVIRGLLTCCRTQILLSSHFCNSETSFLMDSLYPLVRALCEETLECHYFSFEVLTLWLKKVRECLTDLWEITGTRLFTDDSSLLVDLIHIIWTNAESPVDGVPEFANRAFSLLLDVYDMDCEKFGDTNRDFYSTVFLKIMKLPWEAKAKYHLLCALVPYLGTDKVLDQCAEIPTYILKSLSTNQLSPCGSELYKCLIQQQRRELCDAPQKSVPFTELDLAKRWARRWRPVLLQALMSEVTLLQSNSSTHLLPCTFQVFPSAAQHLLETLDPHTPRHLHAWACILRSYRATTGCSPWALQGSSTFETLQQALMSADEKVRLAALNLLCCSPKTNDRPTAEEMSIMKEFIPMNLNCESSPFRQHLQAGVKRFLVRIRDSCLAQIRKPKEKRKENSVHSERMQDTLLEQGIEFVEWLGQLPYSNLAPGHSFQRKKTSLLLLSAVLETCTDTWSPDRKKGQPPANMKILIHHAQLRGHWDFFSRSKKLLLLSCLEDSTNEIRELSTELLLKFFPPSFPGDIAEVLTVRAKQLLCSPRVQEAQMGALMMKVLLYKSLEHWDSGLCSKTSSIIRFLLKELEDHYLTAKADMMRAARTKPIHGVLKALQRCLFEGPVSVCDAADHSLISEVLSLLESISLLLLGVLHGDNKDSFTEKDTPPSFCDMGNAISSLISQQADEEDCVLLSEEHSLVLTCCWVSLKEIGIFLGTLVEKIFTESKQSGEGDLLKPQLSRVSKVFKNILLSCRHWGAIEGCCVGFTKFCSCLLSCSDPKIKDIPVQMLKQGLQVVQCPRSASVTRRAAGLPMLILSILTAEETSKARPLLVLSMQTLMDTARTPVPQNWDQTLDLPQVCAVHALQALVRGAALGAAVLQFASDITILSLTLLSSSCWAMRNAALQLYSSLCFRMLGQKSSNEDSGAAQHGMTAPAFLWHYRRLQPFLLTELTKAAEGLQGPTAEAKLHLQPSLFPILTLLAQLQPVVTDTSGVFLDFSPPLLQLSASPIYSVRVMASKALVAMTPTSEHMYVLLQLTAQLPGPQEGRSHNQLHGRLLQIKAVLEKCLCANSATSDELREVVSRVHAAQWLVTEDQRCPLVRAVYLSVADCLREELCEDFLCQLSDRLTHELHSPPQALQIGLSSFHQQAVHFLCGDLKWALQIWDSFSKARLDLRLALVTWVLDGRGFEQSVLREEIQKVLQSNLKEALLSHSVEYRTAFLTALVKVMTTGESLPQQPSHEHLPLLECLELLFMDLEDQKWGPEFLSQALSAAGLLLSQCPKSSINTSMLQRWCCILECHRAPVVPEVLRIACSEALCVTAAPLTRDISTVIKIRLINTGIYLLQDQSQQVRLKAARFAALLHRAQRGGSQENLNLMQVSHALLLLLDLLLEEHWDAPGTLEVLLSHLPKSDLRCVVREASALEGFSSLYEQDEANVFAEPAVMSAHVLPHLLQMAEKSSESSGLAQSLTSWAEEHVSQVLDDLVFCEKIVPENTLSAAWLGLLVDAHFHTTLCGLLTRAAFLLRLLETSAPTQPLCDPSTLHTHLQNAWKLLRQNGVHFPSSLRAALAGELKQSLS
ncbi:thyroid adenoma-associated protein homolog isoform X2 [Oryzias melastigma]|uniref:Si:ch211-225b11.4 n=1 Tax=Oryzias melastigma TaxID=30732 RepID=A0A3B3CZC3_ORYME|nr:thyroid adenoma-associated protein homolog isoform X2 [Oryzias melastigma]